MILALETATDLCAAALVHDGRIIAERSIEEKKVHSERLLPMVDEILRSASVDIRNLAAVAVSIGPGSFTGLRIGLSTAKGLAVGGEKAIIAIPTLHALAFECHRRGRYSEGETLCPLIDAKRDEAYYAFFAVGKEGIMREAEDGIESVSRIAELAGERRCVVLAGDGVAKLKASGYSRSSFRLEDGIRCSAASVGLLAEREGVPLQAPQYERLEPVYLRDFVTTQPNPSRNKVLHRVPLAPLPITHSPKD
ncbi:MAG TPA: tRNA (adenosine(37)-N6)-threonylcarbamoyltransferase complex dimerization subunit type 1 TsaB [Bacteroidota bacterium]|nr:tRNA (adenosine(37)-N6)-threonylcarbamoyltransferase complex dimerization subunit type 1 TsaB [Bacteroidota bacterium]